MPYTSSPNSIDTSSILNVTVAKSEIEIILSGLCSRLNKSMEEMYSDIKEVEEFEKTVSSVKTIPLSKGQAIQKARNDKGYTRKHVANLISIKESILADYETGKAIPNPQVLTKLRRVLGCNKF